MDATRMSKTVLVFPIGFVWFYFIACWLGIDILDIPLWESFLLLGPDAQGIKVLLISSPVISMLIAGSIGGAIMKGSIGRGNRPTILKFLGSSLIPLIIIQFSLLEWGSSIILGQDRFYAWFEGIRAVRFRMLFCFGAPIIGIIGASMLTSIFAGRETYKSKKIEKTTIEEEKINTDYELPQGLSMPLVRFFGSLAFMIFGLGSFLILGTKYLGFSYNELMNPFHGLGGKGVGLLIMSLTIGVVGAIAVGWPIGAMIKMYNERTKQIVSLLWHYGANGSAGWAFISFSALFLTVGQAGMEEMYLSIGTMGLSIVLLGIGMLGGWFVGFLIMLTKGKHLLSSILPIAVGLSMGFLQSKVLDVPYYFEMIAGFIYPFFLIPVSNRTMKRDLTEKDKRLKSNIEIVEQRPKRGIEHVETSPLILAEKALVINDFRVVRKYLEIAKKDSPDATKKAIAFRIESDMLRKKGNIKGSIGALKLAIGLDSIQPAYWNTLAARRLLLVKDPSLTAQERKVLLNKAQEESIKAVSLGDYARPHQNLSQVYLEQGMMDKAKEHAMIAQNIAQRQIDSDSSREAICKGCPLQGKFVSECQKCLDMALGTLRDMELAGGEYRIK